MKGIILAGGSGTRLAPMTDINNKHLLYVHGKMIIDYPVQTILNAGITDLRVVLGGNHFSQVVSYLKDGSDFGLNITYTYQKKPSGIAQAINLCKDFTKDDRFMVVLGDNIFENPIKPSESKNSQISLYSHKELTRFGVASLSGRKIVKIEEKPVEIDYSYDNYAITGCYIFDYNFYKYFNTTTPSLRGEFEITDIIRKYHEDGCLDYNFVEGMWSDAGTHESLQYVNNFFFLKDQKI